ncbi:MULTISPECIES: carbon storage regulator CsrA [Bythopirellula]|uniref:Translational regulator CsrA n=2 Tax=Bythopirellula TaxID=1400386 RepID=A0A5C6CL39_9BACT|nr:MULTISPECIES: carbon storage regulator CsrA [Bythopirellula]QEG36325.1 hypothetical protein Pr1d_36380 [Bythopirellula goksoeyrii]TWU24785.1 hypothetical protein Pla144_36710 [Bythopirellula polymerisocia]
MLVLSRKVGEAICVRDDIVLKVLAIQGDRVRLGIRAPKHIAVHREEIAQHIRLIANEPAEPPPAIKMGAEQNCEQRKYNE